MYEFDTEFIFDPTEDLSLSYTGSGVHLFKDVTFSFSLIDQQQTLIENDYQLINNPLVNVVAFDILDTGGNVIFENYKSGTTSRSITVTANENESIFGSYTKDFGVRAKVTNHVDGSVFSSDFYAYSNVPQVSDIEVLQGIPIGTTGQAQPIVYDQIEVYLNIANNFKYINMEKYDIYVSTGNDISLYSLPSSKSSDHPNFLFSKPVQNLTDRNQLIIKRQGLLNNTNYYFAIVPYSSVGSGDPVYITSAQFSSEITGIADSIVQGNQFQLNRGIQNINITLITGTLPAGGTVVVDSYPSGSYATALYTTQIYETGNYYCSDIKWINQSPTQRLAVTGLSSPAHITYSTGIVSGNFQLYAAGCVSGGPYKLYRTLI